MPGKHYGKKGGSKGGKKPMSQYGTKPMKGSSANGRMPKKVKGKKQQGV